jgi:CRISPR-associated protein Cas1
MLAQYAFCPRLGYLEWAQGEFSENYEVVEGRFLHRRVDQETGNIPPDGLGDFEARSVWLSAPSERLTARMDLIEGSGGEVTVVDYKRGQVPENPERSWESDRIQLCAQGLVLRENGYNCPSGILYYVSSKTRVPVEFSDELIHRTRKLLEEFRATTESAVIPPPLVDSPKCVGCSLSGICLPDETNFLIRRRGGESSQEEGVRRLQPARNDASPLYVQQQGAFVGKKGETLEIRLKGEKLAEARIFETSQVCIFGNVQISTQVLRELCMNGISVTIFTTGGWFCGMAHGMTHKNVELRIAQFKACADKERRAHAAAAVVYSKIRNCRTILMRNHSDLPQAVSTALMRLSMQARHTTDIETLLGIEGAAGHAYFSQFNGMLKGKRQGESDAEWRFDFNGRNRRPPLDPVNALLSYGYSLLTKDITVTLMAAGLDPFLGFYHAPRYGRPALALDLMEEFRPIIADSVAITVINNAVLTPEDFVRRGPSVALKDDARKKFIEAYERRMETLVTHPVFDYRISYRRVLDVQARLLGRWVLGEIPAYQPFRTR